MENLQNDLLLRAAQGLPVERTPVWLMRQAGRILPEYRAVRAKLSGFKELVTTPELACEVTIQPVDLLGVDAAIIFSDILVIPEALGLDYEMIPGKGPFFNKVIENQNDVAKLNVEGTVEHLQYVMNAIRLTKRELNGRVPLIGFAGAPWTILCYMIEGEGSKTFSKARRFLIEQPALAHQLLSKITEATTAYLQAQIEAGANLVQLFDSWAGVLSRDLYNTFALPYLEQICRKIETAPTTVFAKGAHFAMSDLAKLPCQTLGLDWGMDVEGTKKLINNSKTLQGNLDPALLYGSEAEVQNAAKTMLSRFAGHRHIANLGHGVYPDTDPGKVKLFVDTIKNTKK